MRLPALSPVGSCGAPLATNYKYVAVELLTRETLYYSVDNKCKLSELCAIVLGHMCNQGMQDPSVFGLAVPIDGEYVFVDLDSKVSKYAPKSWRMSQTDGLDESGRPLLQFSLRVKFYVDCHLLLRDRVTRHHYYLQLRENVLVHKQTCRQNTCFLLAAWALQADVGNYRTDLGRSYFQPAEYFPTSVITKVGVDHILDAMPSLHSDNVNMPRTEAELAYIREASAVEAPHNLHIYRLRRRKCDVIGSVLLGVCPNGIELYEEEKNNARKLLASFVWTNIGNLSFEKKKFEIRALTQKFTLYTSNDDKSKQLLNLCREMHIFTQSLKDRLADLKQGSDDEGGRSMYESARYESGSLMSSAAGCWEYLNGGGGGGAGPSGCRGGSGRTGGGSSAEQRVSVVSSTSSNTTSGIVSDRTVQSLDGSDDEIIINSPPAADSVESGVDLSDGMSTSQPRVYSSCSQSQHRQLQHSPQLQLVATSTAAATCSQSPRDVSVCSSSGRGSVSASPSVPAEVSRTGSVHSSSSQQSGATVRSRCSLLMQPVATANSGPAFATSAATARQSPVKVSNNCCSTCGGDEDDDAALSVCSVVQEQVACACVGGADGGDGVDESAAARGESSSHAAQISGLSAASTLDSTRALEDAERAEFYNLSEDYGSTGGGEEEERTRGADVASEGAVTSLVRRRRTAAGRGRRRRHAEEDNVSVRSGASATSSSSSRGEPSTSAADMSATELDYSSVGSVITTPGTFPRRTTVSDTFDTDSDYVQVPYDEKGEFRICHSPPSSASAAAVTTTLVASARFAGTPAPVAMSRVTTVTRFGLAQSCQAEETSDPAAPAVESCADGAVRIVSVPVAPASGEAPARFITCRPLVTKFRAQVTSAPVPHAPSFAAPMPSARRFSSRLQLAAATVKPRPVHALLRSLSQSATELPVVGANNYLDVHASKPPQHPCYTPAPQHPCYTPAPQYANLNPAERLQQQLLSDSDYVIYPLKDPDISRQEYMDAKDCSLASVSAAALPPPPPYPIRNSAHHLSWRNLVATSALSPVAVGRVLRTQSDDNLLTAGLMTDNGLPEATGVRPPPPSYWESGHATVGRTVAGRISGATGTAGGLHASSHTLPPPRTTAAVRLSACPTPTTAASTASASPHPAGVSRQSLIRHQQLIRQHLARTQQPTAATSPLASAASPAGQHQQLVSLTRLPAVSRRQQPSPGQADSRRLGNRQLETGLSQHASSIGRRSQQLMSGGSSVASAAAAGGSLAAQRLTQQLDPTAQRRYLSSTLQAPSSAAKSSGAAIASHAQLGFGGSLSRSSQQLNEQLALRAAGRMSYQQQLQLSRSCQQLDASAAPSDEQLDIAGLRAASQAMDLPLISALCNDRLLRQASAASTPSVESVPPAARPRTWHEARSLPHHQQDVWLQQQAAMTSPRTLMTLQQPGPASAMFDLASRPSTARRPPRCPVNR